MPLARLLCEECAAHSCLVECHAPPGNETRQWHVSTSRKHPLSVISPYDVGTRNMRLIGRRCIINGSTGWGGDAYYASLQLCCCIHKNCPQACRDVPLARLLCDECADRSCLVECHAPPGNETRQWHVSTSRKHPLSVISPYDVGTRNMRLIGRRCIINGSTGWGGDAYYASLQLCCCIHKIVRRVVETCHWRVSSARNAPPGNETRQWHVSTSRKHPLSVISPYDVETHNMRLPDRR